MNYSYDAQTGEYNDSLLGDFIWSNANVGEVVPEVMTPLSWSIVQNSFLSLSIIPGYNMVGNICGRLYGNVSVMAEIVRFTGRSVKDFGNELGGGYGQFQDWLAQSKISPPWKSILPMIRNILRVGFKQARMSKHARRFLAENPFWCGRMKTRLDGIQSSAELADFWQNEVAPYAVDAFWMVFTSAMQYSALIGKIRRELSELASPEDVNALLSNVSEGSELLASLGPTVGVWKVYRGEMTRAEFLARYGHRGSYEKSVFEPGFLDKSVWLDRLLEDFAKNPADVDAALARQRDEFNRAWNRFQSLYPRKAGRMGRQLKKAAKFARLRESVRDEFMRITLVSRPCVLRAAEYLGVGEDVYFLTIQEIWDALRGIPSDGRSQIQTRKAAYERQKSLPLYPPVIRGSFDAARWASDSNRRSDYFDSHEATPKEVTEKNSIIKGMAGSAGVAEGVVRCVARVEDAHELRPGEILVTSQTNIGWTPVFPRLAAVVTDIGAPLSHAAIVARELGIPAVVGCRNATMRLKTGDRVRVDGGKGVILIL